MDIQTLRKARRYARQHFDRNYTHGHASHAAAAALEAAAEKYDLLPMVEGFCDESGRGGVQYLNAGDFYIPTLVAVTNYSTARFSVRCMESFIR
jgi:hypothetical protein